MDPQHPTTPFYSKLLLDQPLRSIMSLTRLWAPPEWTPLHYGRRRLQTFQSLLKFLEHKNSDGCSFVMFHHSLKVHYFSLSDIFNQMLLCEMVLRTKCQQFVWAEGKNDQMGGDKWKNKRDTIK